MKNSSPIVSYMRRRSPSVGEQIRVTSVDAGAEGLAQVGELVTVTRVETASAGCVDSAGRVDFLPFTCSPPLYTLEAP